MKYTLGIGGSNHGFSSVLLKNGSPVIGIEDERLSGVKYGNSHWAGNPCLNAAKYCLSDQGIGLDAVSHIYLNADLEGMGTFWEEKPFTKIDHHLCHASASYFNSPFEQAATLVIDGRGGAIGDFNEASKVFPTVSYGIGEGNQIHIETRARGQQKIGQSTWSYIASNSIGWFYTILTEALGLGENAEGKTMALAAFGEPLYKAELLTFCRISKEFEISFDPYAGIWEYLKQKIKRSPNVFKTKADLASSGQSILEDFVLGVTQQLYKKTKLRNLCFSGGVSLNGVVNRLILQKSGFSNLFLFPGCGDNGLAMGAAMYGYYSLEGHQRIPLNRPQIAKLPFLGKTYSEVETKAALRKMGLRYHIPNNPISELGERLKQGQIVAIYQGRAEFGPRALGNRSIIASPERFDVQQRLNRIKKRELFRPFAPTVLEEHAPKYFDILGPSPYMLLITKVKPQFQDKIPGVCHVDQSARVQTINADGPKHIYQLLTHFEECGHPPIILNTSFNLKGMPIVETPEEAIKCFLDSEIDLLYIGKFFAQKI